MGTTTGRLGLTRPVGDDSDTALRSAISANAAILDAAIPWSSGTIAGIPAASLAGRRYYATDLGVELLDTGASWIPMASATPLGTIAHWAGSSDPVDPGGATRWMICDGRAINRSTYALLFTAIGITYGIGNGSTTFNIPDGRARALVATGPQTGCTTRSVGQTGGPAGSGATYLAEETHTLTEGELTFHGHGTGDDFPDHGHNPVDPGHAHSLNSGPSGQLFNNGSQFTAYLSGSSPTGSAVTGIVIGADSPDHAHGGIASDGGSGAHNNLQPFLVVNSIVKVS